MIPKKIHYIWLGGNTKPKNFDLVFSSWKKHAPGFEIIEWNEEKAKEFLDLPRYYTHAIEQKQWAFASDVLRVHILHKYGGLYFDIDQILIKDIPDDFLNHSFFTATYHEVADYYGFQYVGSEPDSPVITDMKEYYKTLDPENGFIIINKIFSDILNASLSENPEYLKTYNIKIYPQEYFYPLTNKDVTANTYAYHLGNTSWIPMYKKMLYKIPFYLTIKKIVFTLIPSRIINKLKKIKY